MARHGIDMALLAAAEPGVDEIGATRVEVADPYSAGKARLLGWTASALRCRAVLHEVRGPRHRVAAGSARSPCSGSRRTASGSRCCSPRCSCRPQTQLVAQRPPHPDESVAAYRRSWLHGFAVQVHRRLVDAERRAEERAGQGSADGPGVPGGAELVLADRRSRVERAYAEAFPAARPGQAVGAVGQRVRGGCGRR